MVTIQCVTLYNALSNNVTDNINKNVIFLQSKKSVTFFNMKGVRCKNTKLE